MKEERIELAKTLLQQTRLGKSDGKYLQTIYNSLTGSRLHYCMCQVHEREMIRNLLQKYFDNESNISQ